MANIIFNPVTINWLEKFSIMSPECIEEMIISGNYANAFCLRILLSRLFGYGIVISSVLIKLPQLVKIWFARDTGGISAIAEFLMLLATFGAAVYGYTNDFPIATYGDSYSLSLQTALVLFFIFHYQKKHFLAFCFVIGCTVLSFLLFSSSLPHSIVLSFSFLSVVLALASKAWQAVINWRNKSTGQLSAITVLLMFAGSLARIFTSQETGDFGFILMYVLMSILNGILVLQLGYYWHQPVVRSKLD